MKLILLFVPIFFISCATLKPGAEKVKLVSDSQQERLDRGNCSQLGLVSSGGQSRPDQVFIIVRNAAFDLGANVVLTRGIKTSQSLSGDTLYTTNKLKGISFKCPDSLYRRLIDISHL